MGGALAPPASALVLRRATSGIRCMPQAGLFDMFKESEAQKAAKEEAWRAQQEVLRRRRNPDAMDEYMTESANRRAEASGSDKELKSLQLKSTGADNLEAWQKLREEGKVKSMDTTERDKDSERWGS